MKMSVKSASGVEAPRRFKVVKFQARGMGAGWKYQLSELDGTPYKPGQWFAEGDMRLSKSSK